MNVFEQIFVDWEACGPLGSCIPIGKLPEVLDRAAARIFDSSASAQQQQDAFSLLERGGGGSSYGDGGAPAMMELMLVRRSGESGRCEGIHFLRFWQAWQELGRRLGQRGNQADDEPVVEEVAIFRDALLRCMSPGEGLLAERLRVAVVAAREMSADENAWSPLQESFDRLAGGHDGFKLLRKVAGNDRPVQQDEFCVLLLSWLHELVRDYKRGARAGKIKAMRDVCQCSRREACFQLGCNGWDMEAALLSFYTRPGGKASAGSQFTDLTSWSSQGAKLRQSEVECPICAEPYEGEKPTVLTCCYQVLCVACRKRLKKSGGFCCPFCRTLETRPTYGFSPGQDLRGGRSGRGRRRSAESQRYVASDLSRGVEEVAAAFREDVAPPQRVHAPLRAVRVHRQ